MGYRHRALAACVVAAAMLVGSTAQAKPFTAKKVTLAVGLGIPVAGEEPDPSGRNRHINDDGWVSTSLQVIAGHTAGFGLYHGIRMDYFFGGDLKPVLTNETRSGFAWHSGLELGWDFGLSESLVLRPKVFAGLGRYLAEQSGTRDVGLFSRGEDRFVLAPEAEILIRLGGSGYFGLSARYVAVSSDQPWSHLGIAPRLGLILP